MSHNILNFMNSFKMIIDFKQIIEKIKINDKIIVADNAKSIKVSINYDGCRHFERYLPQTKQNLGCKNNDT